MPESLATICCGDVLDVGAVIAGLRRGASVGGVHDRLAEALHLHAAVVDVELAGHDGALRGQHPGDRVADRGPAGVAQVDRTGRVGRDELDVDPAAVLGGALAVVRALDDDPGGDLALAGGLERDVDEPRTGDLGVRDRRAQRELGGQHLADEPRGRVGGLGQGHRDVGGVVAVLTVLRALDGGVDAVPLRQAQLVVLDQVGHGGRDESCQGVGGHGANGSGAVPGRRQPIPASAQPPSPRSPQPPASPAASHRAPPVPPSGPRLSPIALHLGRSATACAAIEARFRRRRSATAIGRRAVGRWVRLLGFCWPPCWRCV